MKLAVVLFNLGGPDSPKAVRPFLENLFSDPAIIALPGIVRRPLAKFIAERRAPIAREIYGKIGGCSPIVAETEAQARALESVLRARGHDARAFVAMRYWHPFAAETARRVREWNPERIVLLPLYPQFSTATTASALVDWRAAAADLGARSSRICCFPWDDGFIAAEAELIAKALTARKPGVDYRLLLSAHGLPKRMVRKGDPYQWQVEQTAKAIVDRLGIIGLDWTVCYQSRVGPLEWIGPATDAEVRRAGGDGKGLIVAPVAFVSEHSETLVELDIEYRRLAESAAVPDYIRVPAVGTEPAFIEGLARLVEKAIAGGPPLTSINCDRQRICPAAFRGCGFGSAMPC